MHFNIESNSAGDSAQVGYKVYKTGFSEALKLNGNSWEGTFNAAKSADHAVASTDANGLADIGIMNNFNGTMTLKVKDVTFTFIDDGNLVDDAPSGDNLLDSDALKGDGSEDKYLYAAKDANNFSQIKRRWDNNTTGYSLNESNKTVSLEGSGEWLFTLQEPIDASMIKSIKFAMSDNTGTWAYKTVINGTDDSKYNISDPIYTFPVSATEGQLTAIVIYSGDSSFRGTFHGIMVDMKAAAELTETYTITVYPSSLTKMWATAASDELAADNRWHVSFGSAGKEVCLKLPLTINMGDCENITFNLKEQVGPLDFAISIDNSKKGNWYWNSGKLSYVVDAAGMYESTKYTGDFNEVMLKLNDSNFPHPRPAKIL